MSSIDMCHSAKPPHSAYDFEGLEESLVDNADEDEEEDEDDDFGEADLVEPLMGVGGVLLGTGAEDASASSSAGSSAGVLFDHNLILVRDALIRDSANRTEEDIEIIVRFLAAINSNHDHMTRKRLAPHFVLAEIESRDTRVLTHDEKLDAYCIVAAGSLRHVIPSTVCPFEGGGTNLLSETIGSPVDDVEDPCHQHYHQHHLQPGGVRYLTVGDEFGAHLNDRVVYGEIFTNENFVWVLCVPHVIFDQICGEKAFKTIKDEVTGNVIEMRTNCYLQLPPLPADSSPSILNHNNELGDHQHYISLPSNQQQQQQLGYEDHYITDIVTSTTVPPPLSSAPLPPNSLSLSSSSSKNVGAAAISTSSQPNDNNELIRATKERLYELVLSSEPSEVFIEDFLLTFRIWSEKELSPSKDSVIMNDLMGRICAHIRAGRAVENCVRIVLLWMANHFQDFANENRYLLEEFETVLKERGLRTQLRLFHMNLSAKSVERVVTVTRSDRNASLPFSLIGGYECSARLFIGEIIVPNGGSTPGGLSSATSPPQTPQTSTLDLRPGDRVISINGVDCSVTPIGRAYELCRASTHLSLTVKYDPHLFNALIEGRHETKRQIVETFPLQGPPASSGGGRLSTSNSTVNFQAVNSSSAGNSNSGKDKKEGGMWKQKVKSLVSMTTNQLINSTSNILHSNSNNSSSTTPNGSLNNSHHHQHLNNSSSNSSLSSSSSANTANNNAHLNSQQQQQLLNQNTTHPRILSYEVPEIIKIYFFENNDCRFLPIHSSTTARECIQLAMREFALQSNYSSRDFALYEYSVIFNNSSSGGLQVDEKDTSASSSNNTGGTASVNASSTVVKRLADGTSDLVANLGLNSRLYLKLLIPSKENHGGSHLSDSDIAKEIVKDTSANAFLTLDTNAIARELTARDFRLFCKIEAQQFVYDLAFNNPNQPLSAGGKSSGIIFERTRDLQDFERRTNEEMFWTINQVLGERNPRSVSKRVKVIKKLIRIANVAMKLNNFNLLFAILSGLNHSSVDRLKACWDKVPGKDIKKLQKLNDLMSVHRNFVCLRQKLMEIMHQDSGGSAFIIIPFFPLVKKDLMFIWMANQTYVNSKEPQTPGSSGESGSEKPPDKGEMLVNWEKMRLLSEKIREIQKMTNTTKLAMAAVSGVARSSVNGSASGGVTSPSAASVAVSDPGEPIDPNLLFRIFADATTCEDPRTFSHKRLWENQRMMKRVQSFLDETFGSVSSDEQELLSRSHSCELPQTPNSSHNHHQANSSQHTASTTRSSIASTMSSSSALSHPSPTPSTASSSSNSLSMHSDGNQGGQGQGGQLLYRPLRPKFGQSSPNNLRKLLALSDGSVIVPHGNNSNNNSSNSSHHHNHQSQSQSHSSGGHGSHPHAHHHSHPHHHHHQSSSSSTLLPNQHHLQHQNSHPHHQHHQHHQYSARSSTSSLSSSTSSYYNNLYGCNSNNVQQQQQSYNSGNNGTNNNNSSYHSKLNSYSQSSSRGYDGNTCCGSTQAPPVPPPACCSGALYPSQSYGSCACCGPSPSSSSAHPPMMRTASVMSTASSASSMMMVMPPPQTSGLMHPNLVGGAGGGGGMCPCTPGNQHTYHSHHQQHSSSSRTRSSKVPLPVESSSVTSFRRLEQYQQMTRYREIRHTSTTSTSASSKNQNNNSSSNNSRRPQLPDYNTTMQRINSGGGVTMVPVNGKPNRSNVNPPGGGSSSGSGGHHREDIV